MIADSNIELTPDIFFNSVRKFNRRFSISVRKPSLLFLKELLYHYSQFPYENMSKIIKLSQNFNDPLKIRLPEEVLEDHLQYNFGGTCFSITFFLKTILTFHGFTSYIVMADMNWGENVHCAIIVMHDSQPYLVDPGYLLNQPLILSRDQPSVCRTPFSGIKLDYSKAHGFFNLYTFNQESIKWRYRFKDVPVQKGKFLEFWKSSFLWNSMNAICIATVIDKKMMYVHRDFMRETTYFGKRNYNLKKRFPQTISQLMKIDYEKIEEALEAVEVNKRIKQEMGLWK